MGASLAVTYLSFKLYQLVLKRKYLLSQLSIFLFYLLSVDSFLHT